MADHKIKLGETLANRYEIAEVIGSGSFGTAFKALDKKETRYVVIKGLPDVFSRRPKLVEMFLEAARRFRELDHPALVPILDVLEDDLALVEPLVEGLSLRQLIALRNQENNRFSLGETEPIIEEFARGITFLHHRGLIHGSIKPENIFLGSQGVQLSDAGKFYMVPQEAFIKIQLNLEGADHYVAPELVANPKATGRTMDIYSIGVVVHEMLSLGYPAYPWKDIDVQGAVDVATANRLLKKALSDEPSRRYGSINALVLDMARALGDEGKIKTLESVVLQEAHEEAQAAIAAADEAEQAAQVAPPPARPESQPPAAAEPQMPTKAAMQALFEGDEDGAAAEVAKGQASRTPVVAADVEPGGARAGSNKMPLIAGAGLVVVLVLAAAGYFVMRGQQESAEQASKAALQQQKNQGENQLADLARSAIDSAIEAKNAIGDPAKAAPSAQKPYAEGVTLVAEAEQAHKAKDYTAATKKAQDARDKFVLAKGLASATADIAAAQLAVEQAQRAAAAAAEKPQTADSKQAPPVTKEPAQAATAEPVKKAAAGCPADMIQVQEGMFLFGSDPGDMARDAWESANEKRKTGAYCIDKYEFLEENSKKPKTNVSWSAAAAACKKSGKRLCTELEWERACKGPRNLKYPYGDSFDDQKCSTETAAGDDRPLSDAGSWAKCKSDFGVHDLSGNAMEWTASGVPGTDDDRVAKGGAHDRPDYAARCAFRYPTPKSTRSPELGFRCCADIP